MNKLLLKTGGMVSRLLADLQAVSNEVNSILRTWVGPLLITIGGCGVIYVIVLGVQYARSESDSKRAEAKSRIINCIIGVVAILVLGALCTIIQWDKLVPTLFGYTADDYAG